MASKILPTIVLVMACRSGDRSAPDPSSKPHDAGNLRKVALARPDDDTVAFEASTFKGQNRACRLETLVRLHPDMETPPSSPEVLSVDPFAIDRRTVSCFDFNRCIESGHCAGSSRLMASPTVSRGNYCVGGAAIVSHDAAEEYCRWRGMTVPTFFQWQRAIRGVDGFEFPAGHQRDASKEGLREVSSPDGVIYSSERSGDNSEWLRDRDCAWFTKGGADASLQFVTMWLIPRLDHVSVANQARFRCARAAEVGSDRAVAP